MSVTPLPKRLSKTELMNEITLGKYDEAFVHEELGLFNITAMRTYAQVKGLTVRYGDITPDLVEFLRACRDVDDSRLDDIPAKDILCDPALVILCEDGTQLIADGTHRILKRAAMHLPYFSYWQIPIAEAVRSNRQAPVVWGHFDIGR